MMFKKGSFETGGTIYPVAIKVSLNMFYHWNYNDEMVSATLESSIFSPWYRSGHEGVAILLPGFAIKW